MTPKKKAEYIITNKTTGEVIHDGADRRSILPNVADFRNQIIIVVIGIILTALLATIGYCGDIAYKGLLTSLSDLKSTEEIAFQKIYTRMSIGKANRDNQFNWVAQECCQNAKIPPPISLPQ